MSDTNWLHLLTVGDSVLVKTGWGLDITTVIDIDGASITTRERRYRLSDGTEIRKGPKHMRQRLVSSTPEERDAVRAYRARMQIVSIISRYKLETLTTDQLVRINKILNEPKEDSE